MTSDACHGCGSTTWIASVVDSQGKRTCAECFSGLTQLRARGVPIGALGGATVGAVTRVRGRRKR